jgi:hypothetical protein
MKGIALGILPHLFLGIEPSETTIVSGVAERTTSINTVVGIDPGSYRQEELP